MTTPRASVCIITYNHATYIEAALESVLNQAVDFDYEVIVADDASTDGTREIIERYARARPGTIRLVLQEKNTGGHDNFRALLRSPRGEFVAFLDGDDYWTSRDKLKRQVDFLRAHEDYALCFHDAEIVRDGRVIGRWCPPGLSKEQTFESMLTDCFIPFGAVVYRASALASVPSWWSPLAIRSTLGDWPLSVTAAEHGRIKYFDEAMSAYRLTGLGAWSSTGELHRHEAYIEVLRTFSEVYDRRYAKVILPRLGLRHLSAAAGYALDGRGGDTWRHFLRGWATLARAPVDGLRSRLSLLRSGAIHFAQPLYMRKAAPMIPEALKSTTRSVLGRSQGARP